MSFDIGLQARNLTGHASKPPELRGRSLRFRDEPVAFPRHPSRRRLAGLSRSRSRRRFHRIHPHQLDGHTAGAALEGAHRRGGSVCWRSRTGGCSPWNSTATRSTVANSASRSTPTVDGDRVYALGSYLKLVCMNAANGGVIWSRSLVSEYAPSLSGLYGGVVPWQSAASPLVVGDHVYVASAANTNRLFAFNKHTGALVWRRHNDTMTQASPVAATIHGVPQIVFFTRTGLVSVAPDTGDALWRLALSFSTSSAASPVIDGNLVYCSAAYGRGAAVGTVAESNGTFSVTDAWRRPGDHQNHWGTPIVHEGHLYGPYGQSNPIIECIDMATGTSKWQRSGIGYGSVLKVGGHLLALHEDGTMVLIRFNTNNYDEIDRFRALTGKCWNNAAVSGGRIYVRSTLEAAAYDVSVPVPEFASASATLGPQGFQLTLGSDNGAPIDAARAAKISIFHAQDPAAPFPSWILLEEPVTLENGHLIINDPGATDAGQRFYRAEETP